ncbi:MAG: shikimate kinase [Cryomorphaceae bacterium]|jgi:shikimate kinase
MTKRIHNIVLIGMPGSGKSTIGKRLAKYFDLEFVDTDLILGQAENMPIQSIIDKRGLRRFMLTEHEVLNSLNLQGAVIATGGSAVYSVPAMQHLALTGTRVYLYISLATMLRRVSNVESRGLVKLPQHHLSRLYREREGLCDAAADVRFDNNRPITGLTIDELQKQIIGFERDRN